MAMSHEFPKWLHHPKHASIIVPDAAAEAAQLASWGSGGAPAVEPEQAPELVEPTTNALTEAAPPAQAPKRSGWPKGKPRPPKRR